MGGIGSKLSRPLKNWNVESRAQKIISQDKPKLAPTYKATQKQIDLVNELEPDYKEKAEKKDQQLDEYLKKVYVTSNEVETSEIDQRSNPDRPLPKDRFMPEVLPYGFYEPNEIKSGRVSLRQALEFLANNKKEPEKYTVQYIAAEYKLEKEVVENILSHYSLFNVYNHKEDFNQDVTVSTIPISQNSGIQVRWSKDDSNEKEEVKLHKVFRKSPYEPMPVEEEKKKTLS